MLNEAVEILQAAQAAERKRAQARPAWSSRPIRPGLFYLVLNSQIVQILCIPSPDADTPPLPPHAACQDLSTQLGAANQELAAARADVARLRAAASTGGGAVIAARLGVGDRYGALKPKGGSRAAAAPEAAYKQTAGAEEDGWERDTVRRRWVGRRAAAAGRLYSERMKGRA